jgi:tetratricopeptide (TPR) repeat protein
MAASSSSSSAASSAAEHLRRATDELRAAIVDLEQAIAEDPDDAQAHYQLVRTYAMLGQAHDAVARYRDRDGLISLRCLAQAYVADGRWPEAEATIARAPDDPFMLGARAEMLSRTGHAEEALEVWQKAIDADPESIGGHYMRAFLFERLGRREEAIAEWEAIIAWSRARGNDDDLEWPEQEIARMRAPRG